MYILNAKTNIIVLVLFIIDDKQKLLVYSNLSNKIETETCLEPICLRNIQKIYSPKQVFTSKHHCSAL